MLIDCLAVFVQLANASASNAAPRRDADRQHQDPRRRISQQGPGGVTPPSPALVRHGSKQQQGRKIPNSLVPGGTVGSTPQSAAAQVGIAPASAQHMQRRVSQQPSSTQHPYATARDQMDNSYYGPQDSSRMVSSVGPAAPALSNVRARGGDVGVANGAGYEGQEEQEPAKPPLLIRILTCRCG